jgi:hypothetical protein
MQTPEIIKLFINRGSNDFFEIHMKNHEHTHSTNEVISNEYGYIEEDNECGRRNTIKNITIYSYEGCNYIIGSLLKETYPNVKTIMLDCYRTDYSFVQKCEDLDLDNLICVCPTSLENPFGFMRNIPKIKCALFCDIGYFYRKEYEYHKNERNGDYEKYKNNTEYRQDENFLYRPFETEFMDTLDACKQLKQVVFLTHWSYMPSENEILSAPTGWKYTKINQIIEGDCKKFGCIVYEKVE